MLIRIFFKTSSLRSAIKVPSFATETLPVSSDTTTTILSDSFDIPIAALCLVPNSFAISLSSANGKTQAAAAILLFDITTAPSCNGVFGSKIFTNNCGETSASIGIPVEIISCILISLSITINAPVFAFESSIAAITILYISSFVLVAKSLSIPKNLVNLLVPNCSNALLNSGWNITIIAITPKFIIPVNIQFNIFKFNNPLTQVATTNRTIPFINCHALEPLTIFKKQYNKKITIAISTIKVTNSNGFSCNDFIYAKIFSV